MRRNAVDAIKLLLEALLNRSPSDVTLGRRARKRIGWDNDDEVRGGYALVEVAPRVKLTRPANDVFLDLLFAETWLRLDEKRG